MARFQQEKQSRTYLKLLLSLCVFLLVAALFFKGVAAFSSDTRRRQKESLENALTRSITYCYAVEGSYPESLDYLKEHYGLTYDEDVFFVDYQVRGSNLLPDVTIIEKEER